MPRTLLLLLALALTPGLAAAQDDVATSRTRLNQAKNVLKSRDYDRAVVLLEDGLAQATTERDAELQASYEFQLGLTFQQRALKAQSAGDVARAVTHYERYLVLQPNSGSALNNLAQLYLDTGRPADAEARYKEAIALDDDYRGFYALNLANLLRDQGRPKEAARYYQLALDERPDMPEAIEGLNAVYAEADVPALITHIWRQIDNRREIGAALAALQTLTRLYSPGATDPAMLRQKAELLTCVVVSLSRARLGPPLLDEQTDRPADQREIARLLRGLADDGDVGAGVREVIDAFTALPELDASNTSWWADKGDPDMDPKEGWWPRDGYRILLRGLGDWHRHLGDDASAETFYLYALQLTQQTDREPDLEALVNLSELYVEQGQIDRVRQMTEQYGVRLFQGKGAAYKKSDYRKIYAYHRTLGILYATIGVWGDNNTVASAIFQLEHALDVRVEYNERIARRDALPRVSLDARLVTFLAQGYEELGNPGRANATRLRYAEQMEEEGDRAGAVRLLRAIDQTALNPRQTRQYAALRNRLTQNQ
ncbi:MAG: tetratricopeptide repeat protein [Rhodothermales bacterium]